MVHLTYSIAQGNLTYDLTVDGAPIGQSFMYDVFIFPRNNTRTVYSNVNESVIVRLLAQENSPYKDGVLPVVSTGRESMVNGQVIPYFTAALKQLKLSYLLNVMEAMAAGGS